MHSDNNRYTTICFISRWLSNNSPVVNVVQTKAMIFGTSYRLDRSINIQINGLGVDFDDHINFIGVVVYAKLDFSAHIDALYRKICFENYTQLIYICLSLR